jgi:hypothetical protein
MLQYKIEDSTVGVFLLFTSSHCKLLDANTLKGCGMDNFRATTTSHIQPWLDQLWPHYCFALLGKVIMQHVYTNIKSTNCEF